MNPRNSELRWQGDEEGFNEGLNDVDDPSMKAFFKLVEEEEEEDGLVDDFDDDYDEYCEFVDDLGCVALEDRIKNDQDQDTRWVRLEKGPDDDFVQRYATRQAVLDEIDRVRSIQQEKTGKSSQLYARVWKPSEQSQQQPPRTKQFPAAINGDGKISFSVMQFNTLAEGLSSSGSVPTPFPSRIRKESTATNSVRDTTTAPTPHHNREFGGFSQIPSPELCLDFSLRRWRLMEVILQQYITSDGSGSICRDDTAVEKSSSRSSSTGDVSRRDETALMDIIGLQEVDRYHGFFAPILSLFGYQGRFVPKPLAPGVRCGWYSDGCALFWKTSVFQLVSERRFEYQVGNQVLLLVTLQHVSSKHLLVVAVTHLKAQRTPVNEHIRCAQVDELLQRVDEAIEHAQQLQQQAQQQPCSSAGRIPVLVLGDFNAEPPSQIPDMESAIGKLMRNPNTRRNSLHSTYPVDPPPPGFYTTWKIRGSESVRRVIDYIWYGDISCKSTLQVPDGDDLEEGRLPGLRYPSDHMMIAAKFEF